MFWSDEIARDLVRENPNTEVFTVASGISPSGNVHMGNLREVITTFFVAKSLRDLGKKVRFVYSWDEFDRLRKVPAGVDESFAKYIGMPYSKVPDPYGCHESYAKHFEKPFIDSLKVLGIDVEFLYQADKYQSGEYAEGVIKAQQMRKEIYDIEYKFKTQAPNENDRNNFYPINIYCSVCGKDTTTVIESSDDCTILDYECKCGHHGRVDLRKDFNVKLPWKIDWPMRWKHEGVMFEPGGRDHSSEGGSYQVSSVIAKEIYGIEPPKYRMYDFVHLKGETTKISSSKGTEMLPEVMLKVYPAEIILWLYTRFLPEKSFELSLDSDVLRVYHEFDRMYAKYKNGTADDLEKRIMEISLAGREPNFEPVSASLIASFAPIVNFDIDLLVEIMNKCGEKVTKEQVEERFVKIKYWMEHYCPEQIVKLLPSKSTYFYNTLNDEEKNWVSQLVKNIKEKDLSLEEMQNLLYEITKVNGVSDKQKQKRFFEILYNLLVGQDKGPRLYLFLAALDKQKILELLEF